MIELIQVGKLEIAIIRKKPFEKWISERMSEFEFQELSYKKKRKMFLFWKYGLSEEANENAENNDQEMLKIISEIESETWKDLKEGLRRYIDASKSR